MTRGYFLDRPRNPGVMSAIIAVGNQRALAAKLGVGQSTIHKWLYGVVPAERAIDIEKKTGVLRGLVRPDLFGARVHKSHGPKTSSAESQATSKETD